MRGEAGPVDPWAAAVERLGGGGLVAYPTETVWGLGALAGSERAVAGLRAWKGRDRGQPISVLVSGIESLEELGFELSPLARRVAQRCWPGPLTLVLPAPRLFAAGVARGDGALGVRCSPHPVAAALARVVEEAGLGPVTATSLNRSGAAPVLDRAQALALCGSNPEAPLVLGAGAEEASGAAPSTVLDLAGERPAVLRWGAIARAEIEAILGGAGQSSGVEGEEIETG
jgi:L-threonylcarbamoyladenylate synthase